MLTFGSNARKLCCQSTAPCCWELLTDDAVGTEEKAGSNDCEVITGAREDMMVLDADTGTDCVDTPVNEPLENGPLLAILTEPVNRVEGTSGAGSFSSSSNANPNRDCADECVRAGADDSRISLSPTFHGSKSHS